MTWLDRHVAEHHDQVAVEADCQETLQLLRR